MNRSNRILDTLVVMFFVLAVVWVPVVKFICALKGTSLSIQEVVAKLTISYPVIPMLTIAGCVLLLVWIFYGGGTESPLWKYMPPFCLLRISRPLSRKLVVVLIVVGTIAALVGMVRDSLTISGNW